MKSKFFKLFSPIIIAPAIALTGVNYAFQLINLPSDVAVLGGCILLFLTAFAVYQLIKFTFQK